MYIGIFLHLGLQRQKATRFLRPEFPTTLEKQNIDSHKPHNIFNLKSNFSKLHDALHT